MTKTAKEILERAITKAVDGGWEPDYRLTYRYGANIDGSEPISSTVPVDTSFIFNHDFAKALWGDEYYHETFIVPKELNESFAGTRHLDVKPMWQWHLQQMVVADDPIKYLEENN